jgi:hypothetical protein
MKITPQFLTLALASLFFWSGTEFACAFSLDFETTGQFTNNFRTLTGLPVQTTNGAGNDFVHMGTGTGSSIYDANGAAAGISTFNVSQSSSLTISGVLAFNANGNSFGIHIVNPSNEATGYLALFNVNYSGSSDQFRFSTDANPTSASAGATLANGSFDNLSDVGVSNDAVFKPFSLVYSLNSSDNPVFSWTVGSQTSTATYAITGLSNVEVGIRMFSTNSVRMDNFSIVPEPAPVGTMIFGAVALLLLRRRAPRSFAG